MSDPSAPEPTSDIGEMLDALIDSGPSVDGVALRDWMNPDPEYQAARSEILLWVSRLRSQVERMKADQLGEVEARAIVQGWNSPVFTKDHRKIYDSALAKLRRLSSGDSET